jgi:hypothetical protein
VYALSALLGQLALPLFQALQPVVCACSKAS